MVLLILSTAACRGEEPIHPGEDAVLIGNDAGSDALFDVGDDSDDDSGIVSLDVGFDAVDSDANQPDVVPTDADSGTDTSHPDVVDPPDTDVRVCREDFRQCSGDLLRTCSPAGDAVVEFNCRLANSFCAAVNGVQQCVDWFCEPGSGGCTGGSEWSCNDRGSDYTSQQQCPAGCDPSTGRCRQGQPSCSLPDTVAELVAGEQIFFDLCGAGDSVHPVEGNLDCGNFQSRGEDRIFYFRLDARRDVLLQLADADSERAVDTVLSVRRVCDDSSTQIVCSDDIDCSSSSVVDGCANGGTQPRESRIIQTLEAGDYFVIADQYTYNSNNADFGCGVVTMYFDTAAP